MTHEPITLRARHTQWVECTCGWLSGVHPTQAGALTAHAHHVAIAKDIDHGDLDSIYFDKYSPEPGE